MNLRKLFLTCLSALFSFAPICSQAMNEQANRNSTFEECIICFGNYSSEDKQMKRGGAIILNCISGNGILHHKLHQICLYEYLDENNGCPICKFPVPEAVKGNLKSKFYDKDNQCMICFRGFETGFVECPNCKYRSHVSCLWDDCFCRRKPCPHCNEIYSEQFKKDMERAMREYGVIDIHDLREMKGKSDDEILYKLVERYLGWKVLSLEEYDKIGSGSMFHGALNHVGNGYADPRHPTEGMSFWVVSREVADTLEGEKPIIFKDITLGNKFIETLYEGINAVRNGEHTRDSFLASLRNRLNQKHNDEQEEYEALENNYKICNIF